jgi:hypothetical protein
MSQGLIMINGKPVTPKELDRLIRRIAEKQGRFQRNLNLQRITSSRSASGFVQLKDYSISEQFQGASITAMFKDLPDKLIEYISHATVIVGCVAWLTHPKILQAMQHLGGISIIVQKEDFLRPDGIPQAGWKSELRNLYTALNGLDGITGKSRNCFVINAGLRSFDAFSIEPVRCAGFARLPDALDRPIMHHKFIVFCCVEQHELDERTIRIVQPYAVWTGSFNFTKNAVRSFENAVYIEHPEIAYAFFEEWGQVAALSESLDWERPYVDPDHIDDMS